MRIAVTIIALVLMVVVGLQSCTVLGLESVVNEGEQDGGAAIGVLVALLFLLGGAFAYATPTTALVMFLFAGLLGVAAGASTDFADLTFWGIVAFIMAALCLLGRREKGKAKAQKAA